MNTISKYLIDACEKLGILGEGVFSRITVHSFRATVARQLYAAGFDDASVALRTGHRDLRSLKGYHNLRGDLGRQQQAAIFGQKDRGRGGLSKSDTVLDNALKIREGKCEKSTGGNEVICAGKESRPTKKQRLSEAFTAIEMSGNITVNIYQAKEEMEDD